MAYRSPTRVFLEAAPKRSFVGALDWPGWARSGKDEGLAVEAFVTALPRYAEVAAAAGLTLPDGAADVEIAERLAGGSGTEFGVPSAVAAADRAPVDAAEGRRLAALVEAAWAVFDRTAAAAPEELRKGPRGGGRDRSKIVAHVNEADGAYARELGLGHRSKDAAALRAAMIEVLASPSDGTPLAGRNWPQRYAARRIAWHALDHAWEIEDRTDR